MSTGPSCGGIDRASFLARVSSALGRAKVAAPSTSPPAVDDAIARVTGANEDLVSVFAARAAESGMVVHRVLAAGAGEQVLAILARLGAKRVAAAAVPGLIGILPTLSAGGVDLIPWPTPAGFEPLYQADAGMTDVHAAIAETGTLVCWSGPLHGRGLSLVPPIHIAMVRRSDIVPDLLDYLSRHASQRHETLPSSIVFITGPSKTADIEGVLITGVHGPREVHIVLIEDA